MPFSSLVRCVDLRDAHIREAAESASSMRALLGRFEEIARPGEGAAVILAALARLGTTACDWIDGELRIDVRGDAKQTTIAVASELGAGFREKLFADTKLNVPFEEFVRGVKVAPKLIAPLRVAESSPRMLVLSATAEVRRTSIPPPLVTIDAKSILDERPSAPEPAAPAAAKPRGLEPAPASDMLIGSRQDTVPFTGAPPEELAPPSIPRLARPGGARKLTLKKRS